MVGWRPLAVFLTTDLQPEGEDSGRIPEDLPGPLHPTHSEGTHLTQPLPQTAEMFVETKVEMHTVAILTNRAKDT